MTNRKNIKQKKTVKSKAPASPANLTPAKPAKVETKKVEEKNEQVQPGKGLDVGTAFIYVAERQHNSGVLFRSQRDAFFNIPDNDFVKTILERNGIRYIKNGEQLYVTGEEALEFANLFRRDTKRPLRRGVINPLEKDAIPIIEIILKNAVGPHRHLYETVYYSVPGAPVDADFDVIYHKQVIHDLLSEWGYTPKPINEALAVIFSELTDKNLTGLGISFGGGMTNVCLANLSLPVITFSIARGGDWIDEQVAKATNNTVSMITAFKENSFDLSPRSGLSRIEKALSVYYEDLLGYLVDQIKKELVKANTSFEKPIDIVIAGGTAKVPGFLKRFEEVIKRSQFPLQVGNIKLAEQPLHSVVRGALIASIVEENKKEAKKKMKL